MATIPKIGLHKTVDRMDQTKKLSGFTMSFSSMINKKMPRLPLVGG